MMKTALMAAAFALLSLWQGAGSIMALDRERVYIFAVDANYPPFSFKDDRTGQLAGFDVDMAKAVCKSIGIQCEIVGMLFDEMIPAIQRGDVDVACAGVGFSEERSKVVLFTEKYYRSNSIFIQRDLGLTEVTRQTMAGKTVAVQKGTIQEAYLLDNFRGSITIAAYNNMAEAMDAVRDGQAELALVDGLAAYAFLKTAAGMELDIAGDPVTIDDDESLMAVNLELGELRDGINQAIKDIRHSGEYDVINLKYFDYSIY